MQEKNNLLKTPVRYFKGVGPKKSELLAKLGIGTAEDVMYYLPLRYEDRSNFTAIKDLKIGEYQTVRGEIATLGTRRAKSGSHDTRSESAGTNAVTRSPGQATDGRRGTPPGRTAQEVHRRRVPQARRPRADLAQLQSEAFQRTRT